MNGAYRRSVSAAAGFCLLACSAAVMASEQKSADPGSARDPFWPVGYEPVAGARTGADAAHASPERLRMADSEWAAAQKLLVVNGVMRSGQTADRKPAYGVLINGQYVEAGGVVSVSMNGRVFRWRVVRITETGPVYERVTNEERQDGTDARKGSMQ